MKITDTLLTCAKFVKNCPHSNEKCSILIMSILNLLRETEDLSSALPRNPGWEKIGKICKISGEKFVFSPQFSYIILRWNAVNAVNAVKLCKFTARVSGDLTKIHHKSPLKFVISSPLQMFEPLTSLMSSTRLPLRHLSLTASIFVLNINKIHSTFCKTCAVNFCKICDF